MRASMNGRNWARAIVLALAVAAVPALFVTKQDTPVIAQGLRTTPDVQIEGRTATVQPERYTPQYLNEPYVPTAAQIEARERFEEMHRAAWARRTLPIGASPIEGPDSTEATEAGVLPAAGGPKAPGSFDFFFGRNLNPNKNFTSNIAEPSIAQSGRNLFFTHNWYAARSVNGGAGWAYINPYRDFPAFCCDQDAIYDRSRDVMLWYRQGIADGAGNNQFKLGASTNGGVTWCTYTVAPTSLNAGYAGTWFDYPNLALSNNLLWITTNRFSLAGAFQGMMLMKISLDSLASCSAISITYWNNAASGWSWTPVQGATTAMMLGDHFDTDTMSLWYNAEGSGTMYGWSIDVPAWTFTNRNGTCTVLGGANPCARADQRITGAWLRGNELGFFWNVKEGGGFTYPYINAATFNVATTLAGGTPPASPVYVSRPYIYNPGFAFEYGSASPDIRGNLGISGWYFEPTAYGKHFVGIDDDYNGAPPGWEIAMSQASTQPPTANTWGDYGRTRMFNPQGVSWIATGYVRTLQAGVNRSTPFIINFGRDRDLYGNARFRLK